MWSVPVRKRGIDSQKIQAGLRVLSCCPLDSPFLYFLPALIQKEVSDEKLPNLFPRLVNTGLICADCEFAALETDLSGGGAVQVFIVPEGYFVKKM